MRGLRSAPRPVAPPAAPAPRPLRIQLGTEIGRGSWDGAWWPYGRHLSTEIPDLVTQFPPMFGLISRVVYSAPDWDVNRLRRVQVGDDFVGVGSFPSDHPHVVLLRSVSPRVSRVLRLLLVPPEWDERAARHALRTAADRGAATSAAAILDRSRDLLLAGQLPQADDPRGARVR